MLRLARSPLVVAAGQSVADAYRGSHRPFDHPNRAGQAQARDETDTLVRNVAEDRQVKACGVLFVLMVMMLTIVCRPVGW